MDLLELTRDPKASIDDIAARLDALPHEERLAEATALGRDDQRALYRKAATALPLTLEHFVPAEVPALRPVRHHGKNTLPLPGKHKRFEKRFCRPKDRADRLFGYNHSPSGWLIGPGYFVLVSTEGSADWQSRGTLVVDYFQVPDGPVAEGWPEVVPNTKGLQYFVYNKTRDFMRRVSSHVSIGAAYKVEKALDHYFVLVREG
jgi:hypothetical protein